MSLVDIVRETRIERTPRVIDLARHFLLQLVHGRVDVVVEAYRQNTDDVLVRCLVPSGIVCGRGRLSEIGAGDGGGLPHQREGIGIEPP